MLRHPILHQPTRPEWTCDTDGRPWPGRSCQAWLAAMFLDAPHALRAEMEAAYAQAVTDLPDDRAALRKRIVGWLEAGPASQADLR